MSRPFNEFSYSLTQAAELLNADVKNADEVSFTGLTHVDSEVQAGDIFLAFPGAKVHGAQFIESAISHGAVAVLTDAEGAAKVFALIDAIEELDDVQNVYSNFDVSDEVMASLS